MSVICPMCRQELAARKPALLLRALASDKGDVFLVKAFLCQCGAIFSPSTPEAQEEWQTRYDAKGRVNST